MGFGWPLNRLINVLELVVPFIVNWTDQGTRSIHRERVEDPFSSQFYRQAYGKIRVYGIVLKFQIQHISGLNHRNLPYYTQPGKVR